MHTLCSTFLKIIIWQIFFGMVAMTLLWGSYQLIINVANSQGRKLGRSVSSARISGLTSTQGMVRERAVIFRWLKHIFGGK